MDQRTIAIFGQYGHENLGDESIIEACIQRYRELIPEANVVLFSSVPRDTEARYSLPAFPTRYQPEMELTSTEQVARERDLGIDFRGKLAPHARRREPAIKTALKRLPLLWPTLKFIQSLPRRVALILREAAFLWGARTSLDGIDLMIVTGSNQFLDNFGGPWNFPYTVMKWALLCRLRKIPVAYLCVGAGPLDVPLSHKMIRLALRSAVYLSFRDHASKAKVDPTDRFGGDVSTDLAFSIDVPLGGGAKSRRHKIVAVNPMAVYDARYWYIKDTDKYQSYVNRLAEFVEWLLDHGNAPRLFATQPKDSNVIVDISERLVTNGRPRDLVDSLFFPLKTVNELLSFLLDADIVVPTRFHGTVLGLWAGKPTIGTCYYRKAVDVLGEFGQQRFAFEVDDFSVSDLTAATEEIIERYDEIAGQIEAAGDAHRKMLESQYQRIRKLLNLPPRSEPPEYHFE